MESTGISSLQGLALKKPLEVLARCLSFLSHHFLLWTFMSLREHISKNKWEHRWPEYFKHLFSRYIFNFIHCRHNFSFLPNSLNIYKDNWYFRAQNKMLINSSSRSHMNCIFWPQCTMVLITHTHEIKKSKKKIKTVITEYLEMNENGKTLIQSKLNSEEKS